MDMVGLVKLPICGRVLKANRVRYANLAHQRSCLSVITSQFSDMSHAMHCTVKISVNSSHRAYTRIIALLFPRRPYKPQEGDK
jgi:hypothetical protein